MTKCPKCSYADISGPRYRKQIYYGYDGSKEALVYTCKRCGYAEDIPTHDQKVTKDPGCHS